MTENIWVALIAFGGTCIGSILGVIASAKLTTYRIEQLEKKVDKHNNFASRIPVVETHIEEIFHRLDNLEEVNK